jgi:hypothetical protein
VGVETKPIEPRPPYFAGFLTYSKRKFVELLKLIGLLLWRMEIINFSISYCSRITRYPSFIAQDFFHFSTLIHNGHNLNMKENLMFHGEFLKKVKICE